MWVLQEGTRLGNSFESSSQIMPGPNTVVPPLNSIFGTGNSQGGSLQQIHRLKIRSYTTS